MTEPLLIDCHSDVMIDVFRRRRAGERNVLASVHLPRLAQGGIGAFAGTVGGDAIGLCPLGTDRPWESALAMLDALHEDAGESGGRVAVAASGEELERLARGGVLAILPTLEGASAVGDDLSRLEELHARGVRAVGLTWNSRNALATGLDSGDGGLTALGRRAIAEMNRLGLLVDVSHSTPETFWDVVAAAEAPIVASHANARSAWDHPRNLDDAQLDALAASGGVVGLVLYPGFIGRGSLTIENVLDHAEALVERIGEDAVVIGADFIDYALEEMTAELATHGALYDESEFVYPEGVEDCRTLGRILDGLRARGYDAAAVAKIAGGNFLRVLERVERAVATS